MKVLVLLLLMLALATTSATAAGTRHTRTAATVSATGTAAEAPFQWDPVANPKAVVLVNHARFTVLTPYVVRLEWSLTNQYQDSPTIVAVRRNLPVPRFASSKNVTHFTLSTDYLSLVYRYDHDYTFNSTNIAITVTYKTTDITSQTVATNTVTWRAVNHEDTDGNLYGTIRTLDGQRDQSVQWDCKNNERPDLHCTYGMVSRNGYVVVDDTNAPSFDRSTVPVNNDTWPWFADRSFSLPSVDQCTITDDSMKRDCAYPGITKEQCLAKGCCTSDKVAEGIPTCYYSTQQSVDYYFFGHGHSYKQAMADFTAISGPIPIPPRYTFGIFFSRYWAYASYEEKQIVKDYVEHSIPLDTLVIDMDWHITAYKQANAGVKDQAGQEIGWTGFTFDDHLFGDYQSFLRWCKELGLRNTLNLHPASGIQPWEESYSAMAKANGIDPTTGLYVPFNATSKLYISTWFNITLRALEHAGIDLWWLDWQQGEDWIHTPSGLNPTIALNYEFYTNPFHWQSTQTRPGLLHRWGGLGNHRYQVGFSGDVIPNWDTLALETYFTPTASNVGYTYWSHDLGGHVSMPGPELYTRWLQFGCFSPVFRTHCTKDVNNDRRIYTFPWNYYDTLKRFTKLRQSLMPYIYTHSRLTYETSLGLLLPLYYEHPDMEAAYQFQYEYYFGRDLLVAPISQPINETSMLVQWQFWLPEGQWTNIFTLDSYTGPMIVTKNFTLDEMPVLAKSGAIISMLPDDVPALGQAQLVPSRLKFLTIVGGSTSGATRHYDDSGDDSDYQSGHYCWTDVSYTVTGSDLQMVTFTIAKATGLSFSTMPKQRTYEIHLRGVPPAVNVSVNGVAAVYRQYNDLSYAGARLTPAIDPSNHYSYDGATLTTIVYVNTPMSTDSDSSVTVTLLDSVRSPVFAVADGFAGKLARFITAKATLDDQWGVNTVFQDDYPHLLYAAQTGEMLTYQPTRALQTLKNFMSHEQLACRELTNITGLIAPVLQQLTVQLC